MAGTRNRLWLKLVPMGGLAVLLFSGLAGNLFGDSVPSIPPEARYKNQQVTMPPEIVAFVIERGNLAESIARQQQLELSPDIIAYFEAVKAGRLGESQVLAAELQKQAKTTNSTSLLKGPVWQVCLDVVLVAEALADRRSGGCRRAAPGATPSHCTPTRYGDAGGRDRHQLTPVPASQRVRRGVLRPRDHVV